MTDPRTIYIDALRKALPGGLWVADSAPGRIISNAADVAVVFRMSAIVFEVGDACTCVSSDPDMLARDVRRLCAEGATALREQAAELLRDAADLDVIAGTPPA